MFNFFKKKKNFEIHEDIDTAFQPLVDYLSENMDDAEDIDNTLEQYMYMCHDAEKTYYKHDDSREYFNIRQDGSTEGTLKNWRDWE